MTTAWDRFWSVALGPGLGLDVGSARRMLAENAHVLEEAVIETLAAATKRQLPPEVIFARLDASKSLITRHLLEQRRGEAQGGQGYHLILNPSRPQYVEDYFRWVSPGTTLCSFYMQLDGVVWAMLARDRGPGAKISYALLRLIPPEEAADFKTQLLSCLEPHGGGSSRTARDIVVAPSEARKDLEVQSRLLEQLGSTLLPCLAELGPTAKLVLLPHRLLHALPLHAMSIGGDSGRRYYLDDFFPSISYASCLPELLSRPPRSSPGRPAALAVLDLASTDLEWLGNERRFFEGIRRRFEQQGLALHVASRAADLPSDLSAYRSINWSGHACSSPIDWGSSFLQLDGVPITAAEIANSWQLTRRPVVTLAACSSAIDVSQVDILDEYCGLDLAFRIAGAEAVFATLWRVGDAVAALASTILFQSAWNSKSTPAADVVLFQRCLRTGRWGEYFLTDSQLAQLPSEDAEHTRQVQQDWLRLPQDYFAHERHWSVFRCFGGSAERR